MNLNVLLINDGVAWVVQCLQFDIAAQGKTIKEAQRAFEYVFSVEVAYLSKQGKTLDDLPQAPTWYWDTYREGFEVNVPTEPSIRVPTEMQHILNESTPSRLELRLAA